MMLLEGQNMSRNSYVKNTVDECAYCSGIPSGMIGLQDNSPRDNSSKDNSFKKMEK